MSENMNGVSAGNAANKTYANTKYKDFYLVDSWRTYLDK